MAFGMCAKRSSFDASEHKSIKVPIKSVDTELEFEIQPSTTGKQLFTQVVRMIGIRETWYFGLQYKDTHGLNTWLRPDKRILQQNVPIEAPSFRFRVKFYPETIEEIIEDVTLRLIYMQVKEQILLEDIYCPLNMSILLASFAVQFQFGDYQEDLHREGTLDAEFLLPRNIIIQHNLGRKECEDRIVQLWKQLEGMDRNEAMIGYLKRAQELEMFGIDYYEICNKKGAELYLGIHARGLKIYDRSDKLNIRFEFPWAEVRAVSYDSKRFVVESIYKKSNNFVFSTSSAHINEHIFSICMGNHEMYMRRRNPPTAEVEQLKHQVKEERYRHKEELDRLVKETETRHATEAKERGYELEMAQMQRAIEVKNQKIVEASEQIREMEYQLEELSKAQAELRKKEEKLNKLNQLLESKQTLSTNDIARLMSERSRQEDQVAQARMFTELKRQETDKLKREVSTRSQYLGMKVMEPSVQHQYLETKRIPTTDPQNASDRFNDAFYAPSFYGNRGVSMRTQKTNYFHGEPSIRHQSFDAKHPVVHGYGDISDKHFQPGSQLKTHGAEGHRGGTIYQQHLSNSPDEVDTHQKPFDFQNLVIRKDTKRVIPEQQNINRFGSGYGDQRRIDERRDTAPPTYGTECPTALHRFPTISETGATFGKKFSKMDPVRGFGFSTRNSQVQSNIQCERNDSFHHNLSGNTRKLVEQFEKPDQ